MTVVALVVVVAFAAWVTAEPDQVSAGIRGATVRAVSDGWRAGQVEARTRWVSGQDARDRRRKAARKRHQKTWTGRRWLNIRTAAGRTAGVLVRGTALAVPVLWRTGQAAWTGARTGWADRRRQRTGDRQRHPGTAPDSTPGRTAGPQPQPPPTTIPDPNQPVPVKAPTPDTDTAPGPTPAGTAPGQPPASTPDPTVPTPRQETDTMTAGVGEIVDHSLMIRAGRGIRSALEAIISDLRQMAASLREEQKASVDYAAKMSARMDDTAFGAQVQKAVAVVEETATQVGKQLDATAEQLDILQPLVGNLAEAVAALEQVVKQVVGS